MRISIKIWLNYFNVRLKRNSLATYLIFLIEKFIKYFAFMDWFTYLKSFRLKSAPKPFNCSVTSPCQWNMTTLFFHFVFLLVLFLSFSLLKSSFQLLRNDLNNINAVYLRENQIIQKRDAKWRIHGILWRIIYGKF